MKETKTAEIKFRATPSFKASLQAAASVAEETMSEYIEKAVQSREREEHPLIVSPSPLEARRLHEESEQSLALEVSTPGDQKIALEDVPLNPFVAPTRAFPPFVDNPRCGDCGEQLPRGYSHAGTCRPEPIAAPQTDVGTSGEVGAGEAPQYPWMFSR